MAPNQWPPERCIAEARRLAQTSEWIQGLPAGARANVRMQAYQPGDEVIPRGSGPGRGRAPRYRYFIIGTFRGVGGIGHYRLLRSDGTQITTSSIARVYPENVHRWNDATVQRIAWNINYTYEQRIIEYNQRVASQGRFATPLGRQSYDEALQARVQELAANCRILADALEEAGYDNVYVLNVLRTSNAQGALLKVVQDILRRQ